MSISKQNIKQALEMNLNLQTKYGALMQQYLAKAVEYKHKIDTAKTDYKKRFYTKKLEKNNMEALEVLSLMESVKSKIAKLSDLDNKTGEPDKQHLVIEPVEKINPTAVTGAE
jgi:hypothetical protein